MTLPLTEKQERLWRFIGSCERSPTHDEMARALGYPCKGKRIAEVVSALERKGFAKRLCRGARSIIALHPDLSLVGVPTDALTAELERRRRVDV